MSSEMLDSLDDALALREEFQLFRDAARSLEDAYEGLKDRASRVDRDLAFANRALKEALEEREAILDAIPLGVFRVDGDRLSAQNSGARSLAEALDMPTLRRALEKQVEDSARKPDSDAVWIECEVEDKSRRSRQLRCKLLLSPEQTTGLAFIEDQTTLLHLRREVERLGRLGSLSELSLGIAHEICNPLNAVAGFATLLKKNPTEEKARAWASHIESGVKRIHSIIRDLLAFARPEQRGETVSRPLSLWVEEARRDAPTLEIELTRETADIVLRADPRAMGKVISNLFRNAVEAGATSVTLTARKENRTQGNVTALEVRDDGPGVPVECRERIFDPFVSTKDQGTGLGLAFCSRALEAMGGGIRLLDDSGGAAFEIWTSDEELT